MINKDYEDSIIKMFDLEESEKFDGYPSVSIAIQKSKKLIISNKYTTDLIDAITAFINIRCIPTDGDQKIISAIKILSFLKKTHPNCVDKLIEIVRSDNLKLKKYSLLSLCKMAIKIPEIQDKVIREAIINCENEETKYTASIKLIVIDWLMNLGLCFLLGDLKINVIDSFLKVIKKSKNKKVKSYAIKALGKLSEVYPEIIPFIKESLEKKHSQKYIETLLSAHLLDIF